MDEEILLSIRIQEKKEDVEDRVEGLRKNLTLLKTEQASLRKELKDGVITNAEYSKSQKAIQGHMATTTAELKKGEDTLAEYAQKQEQATKAIQRMNQGLQLLGPSFAKLNADQQEHALSTKEIGDRINELSNQFRVENAAIKANASSLDKLDDVIGEIQTTYRGLSQAQRENKDVGGKLLAMEADLTRQQEKHQKVIDGSRKGIREYIRDIDVMGINVGSTVDSFKSGAQGAGTFAKAIFTGRGALIALAAVPIIAVLSGLYIILTKSQKGMDFLEKATSGLSAVLSAVSSKVIAIGESLANAWDNPKQAVVDFGNFAQQNLINRFTALGVIIDGIRNRDGGKIADGMVQLATGATGAASKLKNVYNQGVAVADLSIRIREEEIKLNTERAKSEKIIERQKQIAEDATKTTQVRAAAAKAAFAESQKIQNAEEAQQKRKLALAKAQAKQDQNNRDSRDKVSQEAAKLDEIAKNRIGERTELQNQLNTIEAEGATKALENAKKVAAQQVAIAEEALIQAKKNGEDTVEIEAEILRRSITLIQAKADAEKVAVEKGKGAQSQRKLIQAKADQEILEATQATALKVSEIIYKAKVNDIEIGLAMSQRGSKQELAEQIKAIEAERNKAQEAAKVSIKDKEALLKENTRLVAVADRKINDAREAFEQQQVSRAADLANVRLQQQLDLGGQSLDNERDVAAKRIDLEEQTQIKLLDIARKYGQITDEEYFQRVKAANDHALASREALNQEIAAKDRENEIAMSDARLIILKDGSKKQLDETLKQLKKQREQAIKAAKDDKKAIDAINEEFNNKEAKAREKYSSSLFDKITDSASKATALLSTIVDAQVARQTAALDQQYEAILSSASLSADARAKIEKEYEKKKEKIATEAAERRRKIALAENLIATARGITESFKLPPPFNFINAALVAAQGIAQQIVIDNQKFELGGLIDKKGAQGGLVNGPSHAQGGVKFQLGSRQLELEGGEAVINKKSTAKYFAQLSAINADGGNGVAFAGVGVRAKTPPMFDVRHAVPRFQYGGTASAIDAYAISNAIQQGMKGITIYTAITDIKKADKIYTQAVSNGDS